MKTPDSRTLMLALRAWIDEDASGRNGDRLAAFVVDMAMSGHFGFFKLVIDLVDGKIHQTAEDELTFEADYVVVCAKDESNAECPVGTKNAA